jgi:hypothetical protein
MFETHKKILAFARATLDDDEGINEIAMDALTDLIEYLGVGQDLLRAVDSAEGHDGNLRFFIDPTQE